MKKKKEKKEGKKENSKRQSSLHVWSSCPNQSGAQASRFAAPPMMCVCVCIHVCRVNPNTPKNKKQQNSVERELWLVGGLHVQ
jgi:hypothetical protein